MTNEILHSSLNIQTGEQSTAQDPAFAHFLLLVQSVSRIILQYCTILCFLK